MFKNRTLKLEIGPRLTNCVKELAELQPPMFDLHPMRALFLMSKEL